MYFNSEYIEVNTGSRSFNLNHQRMVFEKEIKAVSWTNADSCNGYQLNSSKCDDTHVFSWDQNVIQGNSVPIPSTSLVDAVNTSVYFKLDAVDTNGAVCQELVPYFVIEKNGSYM